MWGRGTETAAREEVSRAAAAEAARKSITLGGGANVPNGILLEACFHFSGKAEVMIMIFFESRYTWFRVLGYSKRQTFLPLHLEWKPFPKKEVQETSFRPIPGSRFVWGSALSAVVVWGRGFSFFTYQQTQSAACQTRCDTDG